MISYFQTFRTFQKLLRELAVLIAARVETLSISSKRSPKYHAPFGPHGMFDMFSWKYAKKGNKMERNKQGFLCVTPISDTPPETPRTPKTPLDPFRPLFKTPPALLQGSHLRSQFVIHSSRRFRSYLQLQLKSKSCGTDNTLIKYIRKFIYIFFAGNILLLLSLILKMFISNYLNSEKYIILKPHCISFH